ncbi:helix-turn-helix domain-containing protein [Thermopirellula anaerolimosa]
MAELSEYVTVAEAAKLLGRHERIVRRYIEKGYLPAERIGRSYVIERRAICEFQYPKPGNPLLIRCK